MSHLVPQSTVKKCVPFLVRVYDYERWWADHLTVSPSTLGILLEWGAMRHRQKQYVYHGSGQGSARHVKAGELLTTLRVQKETYPMYGLK